MIELAVNAVWRARYDAVHDWAERALEGQGDSATRL